MKMLPSIKTCVKTGSREYLSLSCVGMIQMMYLMQMRQAYIGDCGLTKRMHLEVRYVLAQRGLKME